ncbi:unnamed protein product [Meloidogyne enterolobii]|uniref:Uncharacterized protein n=1 Tax=Meloidogyne enterolobii TaxID=390850 RepID=A0ACB1A0F2_MELEN
MRRRGARGIAGTQSEELSRKNFIDQHQPRPHNLLIGQEKQNNKELIMPGGEEDDEEIKILTSNQQPMHDNNGNNFIRSSSPLSSSSAGFGCSAAVRFRSCPPTPRPAMSQRYLKEGYCQLTSIQTLSQHNRYMFLFDDVLLICKEKGEHNSCYKLKEKVSLEFLWLSSNNCTNSFLLGWPTTRNYIAHFSTEREKSDWFEKLNSAIQRRLRPKSTTIGVFVQIEGRQQQIRREVKNGQRAEDLIEALRIELHLPVIDPHLGHYELCFCPGSRRNSGGGE